MLSLKQAIWKTNMCPDTSTFGFHDCSLEIDFNFYVKSLESIYIYIYYVYVFW